MPKRACIVLHILRICFLIKKIIIFPTLISLNNYFILHGIKFHLIYLSRKIFFYDYSSRMVKFVTKKLSGYLLKVTIKR